MPSALPASIKRVDTSKLESSRKRPVGLPMFSDFLVTVDFKKASIDLMPQESPAHGERAEFQDYPHTSDKKDFIRAVRLGNRLFIPARLQGSDETLFALTIEAPFVIASPNLGGGPVGETQPLSLRLDGVDCGSNCMELKFDRFTFKTLVMPYSMKLSSYLAGFEIGGNLGYRVLRDFRITFDYRSGMVKLDK